MANRLINGGMNEWASATDCVGWTEGLTGASTINRDAATVHEGDYSARVDVDGSNSYVSIMQSFKLVPYRRYKLSFWRKHSTSGKTAYFALYDSLACSYLKEDGSWNSGSYSVSLANVTEWTLFELEFVATAAQDYVLTFVRNQATSSSIWWDDVRIESRGSCGFMLENQFDGSTVTAGTEATNFPASNLKHRWHKRTWRSTQVATTEWVKANRGTGYYAPVDIFLERFNNLTAAATAKIQAAASDSWTTVPLDINLAVDNNLLCAVLAGKNRGEILIDGGLNVWTSATDLTNWVESIAGTSTVNREGTDKIEGAYSCRFDVDALNSSVYITSATITLVSGRRYKLQVNYKMSASGKTAYLNLRDSGSNVYLKEDGTWNAGGYSIVLPNATAWTELSVEFYAHGSYTNYLLELHRNSAASASIYFDNCSLAAAEPPWYQWWRHTLYDTANPDGYLEEGRLYLGPVFEPSRNILAGSGTPQEQDPSTVVESDGGQTSAILREHYRVMPLQFVGLTRADYDVFTAHFATVGTARDFWFCRDLGDPWHETYYVSYAEEPVWTERRPNYFDVTMRLKELR